MLSTGMPVLLERDGERLVGVIAGAAQLGGEVYYQVSLEDVVAKGVREQELVPATPDAVRAVLGWLARDPEIQALELGDDDAARSLYLRSAYLGELREALELVERMDAATMAQTSFEPGTHVATYEGGTWYLGVVMGARSMGGSVMCLVDVMGDVRQLPLGKLVLPQEVPSSASGIRLDARVRFVAKGHELDDDYLATVCSVSEGEEPLFGIAFDDGDVLEDLDEEDLALAK